MPAPPDRDPDEPDTTGIRELLAGLPDPGPMPDDLVARIEARLAQERSAQEQGTPPAPSAPVPQDHRVLDLATERNRRRPGRTLVWLGAAAAGLVATAAVVPQLVDGLGGANSSDTAAFYPSRGAGADSLADEAAENDLAGDDAGSDPGAGDDGPGVLSSDGQTDAEDVRTDGAGEAADGDAGPATLLPLDGELLLVPDLGLVDRQTLTPRLLDAAERQERRPADPTDRAGGLTEDEATSCWRGLAATHSFDRYAAAPARFVAEAGARQGEAVVVLLGLDDDGAARSWVMPRSCTGDPEALPLAEGAPRD